MKRNARVATEGGARTRPAISYRSSQNQIADEYEQLDKARLMVRLIECRFLRSNPRPEQGGLPTRSSAVAVFSRDGWRIGRHFGELTWF